MSQHRSIKIFLIAALFVYGSLIVWWSLSSPSKLLSYIGIGGIERLPIISWLLATVIAVAYIWGCSTISSVKQTMLKFDALKLLAIFVALGAGFIEEIIFRKLLMDYLSSNDFQPWVQVTASAVAFGVAHMVWGIRDIVSGVNAVIATTILGAALAILYLVSGRNLILCIIVHFIIDAMIEPGLLKAAFEKKIGLWGERA